VTTPFGAVLISFRIPI